MLSFTLTPILCIVLVSTLSSGSGVSAVSNINPLFKFGILHSPQMTISKWNEDEYRSIFDELLRRDSEREENHQIGEESFSIDPFVRDTNIQQNRQLRQGFLGSNHKHFSILDAAYMLAGRTPIVSKRFNRIGGNIMMGKK